MADQIHALKQKNIRKPIKKHKLSCRNQFRSSSDHEGAFCVYVFRHATRFQLLPYTSVIVVVRVVFVFASWLIAIRSYWTFHLNQPSSSKVSLALFRCPTYCKLRRPTHNHLAHNRVYLWVVVNTEFTLPLIQFIATSRRAHLFGCNVGSLSLAFVCNLSAAFHLFFFLFSSYINCVFSSCSAALVSFFIVLQVGPPTCVMWTIRRPVMITSKATLLPNDFWETFQKCLNLICGKWLGQLK